MATKQAIATVKERLLRADADGNNLILVDMGRRGYHIQANVLRIPDRWGFFSPENAKTQAKEACCLISMAFEITMSLMNGYIPIVVLSKDELKGPMLPLIVYLLAVQLLYCAIWVAYAALLRKDRRGPMTHIFSHLAAAHVLLFVFCIGYAVYLREDREEIWNELYFSSACLWPEKNQSRNM